MNKSNQRLSWAHSRLAGARREAGYRLRPPESGKRGHRDAPERGKSSEREPGSPLGRFPRLSFLSRHLHARSAASGPAELELCPALLQHLLPKGAIEAAATPAPAAGSQGKHLKAACSCQAPQNLLFSVHLRPGSHPPRRLGGDRHQQHR